MNETVHQVSVQKSNGGHNLITPEEWLRFADSERVELLLGGKIVFLNDEGEKIKAQAALKSLKNIKQT